MFSDDAAELDDGFLTIGVITDGGYCRGFFGGVNAGLAEDVIDCHAGNAVALR